MDPMDETPQRPPDVGGCLVRVFVGLVLFALVVLFLVGLFAGVVIASSF
jgi:hypothetical protein